MTNLQPPDDIVPKGLAPLFRPDTTPVPGPDGKPLCASWTHAAAENYVALKNAKFFDQVDPADFLTDSRRLGDYVKTLTSRQVIEAALPAELYVWQPVEVVAIAAGHAWLEVRAPYRDDTRGAMLQTAGGMPKVLHMGTDRQRAETIKETVIREAFEEARLRLQPDQLVRLKLDSSNDSPSIYAIETRSGTDIPGVVPENLVTFGAVSDRPFNRFRNAITLNGESIAMVAISPEAISDLFALRLTQIRLMESDTAYARSFTAKAGSMTEIQSRLEKAPRLAKPELMLDKYKGKLRHARPVTVTRDNFTTRALVVTGAAMLEAGLRLRPGVVQLIKTYRDKPDNMARLPAVRPELSRKRYINGHAPSTWWL